MEWSVTNQNGTTEIRHYGVKGMKWGVRRTPEELGHKPAQQKKPKWNKKQIRFKLTKEKGFDIPVPQVKNAKMQTIINYGAQCMEPFMSPGGVLLGLIIAPIPGLDAPVILGGIAAYNSLKDKGFLKRKIPQKGTVSHSDSNLHEFSHYGVLGMKWGVRKDEVDSDVWDFINSDRRLNDMSADDFLGSIHNYIGNYTDPHAYNDAATRQAEDIGIQEVGIENCFNIEGWNQSSQREREAAHDYVTGLGCTLMNGILRGSMSYDDISSRYGPNTPRAVKDSIDMFSSMMDDTSFKQRTFLSRKTSLDGIAGLFGMDASDLSDPDALQSMIGSRVVEPGFMSTTLIGNASNMGSSYGDVRMFINAREGSSGMFLEPAAESSAYDRGCYEVTLNKGSMFDIAGINTDKNGKIEAVFLDLIGQEDD